ncbi:hypothetical protein [Endozoicomonas sp. ALB091]|uniref:hypothetical protein n=1 Tax=Endozoicomonas sp. ALB091 TaxID=3403073 RepID=UPI003BB6384C
MKFKVSPIIWSLMTSLATLTLVNLISEAFTFTDTTLGSLSYITQIAIFIILLAVGYVYFNYIEENGSLDNWNTLRALLTNKLLLFAVTMYSIISIFYKNLPTFIDSEQVPITIDLYWISGLFTLISIILFHALAPKVSKYNNYETFYKSDGTNLIIWGDIQKAKESLKIDLKKNIPNRNLSDYKIISKASRCTPCPHIFYIARENIKYSKPILRSFVGLPLIVPLLILPSIHWVKVSY